MGKIKYILIGMMLASAVSYAAIEWGDLTIKGDLAIEGELGPMTSAGDILYGAAGGVATRLAKGSDGEVLELASGVPSWSASSIPLVMVDVNITGANPVLSSTSVSSYTGIENTGLTLANNSGGSNRLTAQIPCTTTEESTGTTCTGAESLGVSFTIVNAGEYEACAEFSVNLATGSGGTMETAFQIVETPNAAQTISAEGNSRGVSSNRVASTDSRLRVHTCGNFYFSSATKRTLRLFYETSVSGTISAHKIFADEEATQGQRSFHFTVKAISYD